MQYGVNQSWLATVTWTVITSIAEHFQRHKHYHSIQRQDITVQETQFDCQVITGNCSAESPQKL